MNTTRIKQATGRTAAILLMLLAVPSRICAAEPYDPNRFEKEILVPASHDAIQFEVLPDGGILFVEFWGDVKFRDAKTGVISTLGKVPAYSKGEVGLLGMAAAPDFASSGHLYVLFCPAEKQGTMRVSRFTVKDGKMPADSERELLAWPYDTEHVYHMGGAMAMDAKGDLYIGNGDNSHWNPGLPVDMRPGRKNWDSQRSAANSRDLRGKILRIHPKNEGGYSVPAGNLFPGGTEGCPEIYAMGIRNPFRISVDSTTGTLYIGDVGPNVMPELGVKPEGYEEINATKVAGNFGWPYFVGPNEALPLYDFEKKQVIQRYDPKSPRNISPNNTGIKDLPPALPALIWFSTVPSKEFPTVGSGGRSIMAGPVYHFDAANPSTVKLPEALDGRLFIYEWMRNWIQTVKLDTKGPELELFLPAWNFRRPIDMKIGPDGALYLIEYGDQWWENHDSRVVRVVYRRGNRPPVASISVAETAGLQPFSVAFDAAGSTDPDGDRLKFVWTVAGKEQPGGEAKLPYTFREPGSYPVTLAAIDPSGAKSEVTRMIHVGNARPVVRFDSPANGSFFDWGTGIPYKVAVTESDGDPVDLGLVAVEGKFESRRSSGDAGDVMDPGLAIMRGSTCFACHLSNAASAGPPYEAVALKYKNDPAAADRLAKKVLTGGTGVWGQLPMPPHPQHTLDQARLMLGWVLSLKGDLASAPKSGNGGLWAAPKKPAGDSRANEGVLILTASYTDDGKGGTLPRLQGQATAVLHSRRKKAALCDVNHGMASVEQVEGETGLIGHFKDGANIVFRDINLDGIKHIVVRAGGLTTRPGRIELRQREPRGELLASVEVKPTGGGTFLDLPADLGGASGLTDLCVVAHIEGDGEVLGLNWIEFKR